MSRLRKAILTMSPLSVIGYIWDSSYDRGLDQLVDGQFDVAVQTFSEARGGERELASANYAQGLCLLYGIGGIGRNEEKALQLLKEVAAADSAPSVQVQANYILGIYYIDKKRIAGFDQEAASYLEKAALANYPLAQYKLGMYYLKMGAMGRKAKTWLIRAQENAKQLSDETQRMIKNGLDQLAEDIIVVE